MGEVESEDADAPQSEGELRSLVIDAGQHGERLDRALVLCVPEFSRSYLQQLLAAGAARLNGQAVLKPAQRVKVGDRIELEMRPTQESQAFRAEVMALDVVYEDAHLLVVNKPAGLVVHPAPGNWSGTLLNGLLGRDAHAAQVPRAGIVHRLDKDTSGLMVVARTRSAMDALVEMIGKREVHRQYMAIAWGHWSGPVDRTVDAAIGRDPRNRLRMAVVDLTHQAGKTASTGFTLLDNADKGCWVQCTLQTGRTHQIRVHMASIGHALVGDTLYGGHAVAGMERQALHAFRLAFEHPFTQAALEFYASLPPDMTAALENWGLRYNRT